MKPKKISLEDYLLSTIKDKQILMGISMILVVLYHSMFIKVPFRYLFMYGYIGVDVFILLSGYGLCYSIEKNNLKTFYKRRCTRILPLYVVAAAIHTAYNVFIDKNEETVWDWICDLTTLSYWHLGGHHIEWYLSALFFLYMCFPAFYYITKKSREIVFGLSVICAFILHLYIDLDWTLWCLIDRIPIYLLGIICYFYHRANQKMNLGKLIMFSTILGMYFFIENSSMYFERIESVQGLRWLPLHTIPLFHLHLPFLWTSMLCPLVISVIGVYIGHISSRLKIFLGGVGRYSLEVYTAQIIIIPLANYIQPIINSYILFCVYLLLEVIGTFFMIIVNSQIKKIQLLN